MPIHGKLYIICPSFKHCRQEGHIFIPSILSYSRVPLTGSNKTSYCIQHCSDWDRTKRLNSQKTPHILPSRVSYGLSLVRIWVTIERVVTAPQCNANTSHWHCDIIFAGCSCTHKISSMNIDVPQPGIHPVVCRKQHLYTALRHNNTFWKTVINKRNCVTFSQGEWNFFYTFIK